MCICTSCPPCGQQICLRQPMLHCQRLHGTGDTKGGSCHTQLPLAQRCRCQTPWQGAGAALAVHIQAGVTQARLAWARRAHTCTQLCGFSFVSHAAVQSACQLTWRLLSSLAACWYSTHLSCQRCRRCRTRSCPAWPGQLAAAGPASWRFPAPASGSPTLASRLQPGLGET